MGFTRHYHHHHDIRSFPQSHTRVPGRTRVPVYGGIVVFIYTCMRGERENEALGWGGEEKEKREREIKMPSEGRGMKEGRAL